MKRESSSHKRKRSDSSNDIDRRTTRSRHASARTIQNQWKCTICPITLEFIPPGDRFRQYLSKQNFSATALSNYIETTGDFRHPLTRARFTNAEITRAFNIAHITMPPLTQHRRRTNIATATDADVMWDAGVHNIQICIRIAAEFQLSENDVYALTAVIFSYCSRFGLHDAHPLVHTLKMLVRRAMLQDPHNLAYRYLIYILDSTLIAFEHMVTQNNHPTH